MLCASAPSGKAVEKLQSRRYNDAWDLCRPGRSGKPGASDEDVEETTSLGDDDEDSSAIEETMLSSSIAFGAPQSGAAKDAMQRELEAVTWGAGELFTARGWSIKHVSGQRYAVHGRGVKLSLLPQDASLPYFTHLQGHVGYDVAERASRITVCDGPLRQPLLDYLLQTGQNENYDQRGTENIAAVSGAAKFLDFNVAPTGDRIYAMKSAMIQADLRRLADGVADSERVSALQRDGAKLQVGSGGFLR